MAKLKRLDTRLSIRQKDGKKTALSQSVSLLDVWGRRFVWAVRPGDAFCARRKNESLRGRAVERAMRGRMREGNRARASLFFARVSTLQGAFFEDSPARSKAFFPGPASPLLLCSARCGSGLCARFEPRDELLAALADAVLRRLHVCRERGQVGARKQPVARHHGAQHPPVLFPRKGRRSRSRSRD